MADTDGGGLLVQIGVTQARMERELAQVVKQASKAAQQAEDAFKVANDNIGKSSGAAFGKLPQQATQAGAAIKNTSGYTANLASQLNDIGVQLAGGQSPFLIMIQQGTQISQLFAQTGGNVRTFGSLLTGAVTSALNPFSLLTFAVIGLGGAAIQYFASVVSGGEDANKTIEKQNELVQAVAKTWGEAVPALQAYVAELTNAKNAADAANVQDTLRTKLAQETTAAVEKLNAEFADLVYLMQASNADNPVINELTKAFSNLREKVAEGKATQEDFNTVLDAAQSASFDGISGINAFIGAVQKLMAQALQTSAAVASMNSQISAASNAALNNPATFRGANNPLATADGTVQNESNPLPSVGPTPSDRPKIELEGLPGQFKADGSLKGRKSGGGRGANAYKDEVASIKERTAALREGTAAQAAVNPLVNDYGFALEKAKAESRLLADAQRAGMAITPQLRDQIGELATGYAQASVEAKQLSESQKDIRKNAEEWASLEKDVFKGFLSDLRDGKSGAEALSNALKKVADKLLDMAVDGIFSTKGGAGGGGTGFFGSLLGSIGKIFGFASGTSNTGGKRGQPAGVVHGQEAVIPLPAGGKVPVQLNTPSAGDLGKKSSRDFVSINLTDDSGRMAEIADQRIHTASGTIVQLSVNQSYKQVKQNMAGLITDAQQRSL